MTTKEQERNAIVFAAVLAVVVIHATPPHLLAGPLPVGSATISVSYETTSGSVTFSDARDFNGSIPGTPLPGAPNIRAFSSAGNAVGVFGRRAAGVLLNNPAFRGVIQPAETLVSHAFFKIDTSGDYFPDLVVDDIEPGTITLQFGPIVFDAPVAMAPSTLMLHMKWNGQNGMLENPYVWTDDHLIPTETFRDQSTFLAAGVFATQPSPNFLLSAPDVNLTVTGDGTNAISIEISFPYAMLENLEETGQNILDPDDATNTLPSPQGFLEPFHFHLEYVVRPVLGNCHFDGTIDLRDAAELMRCFTGDAGGPIDPTCACADYDDNLAVDLNDFADFQLDLIGP